MTRQFRQSCSAAALGLQTLGGRLNAVTPFDHLSGNSHLNLSGAESLTASSPMISHIHEFIFIHINKTGGTSVEKAFVPDADERDVQHKHASVAFYEQAFPKQFRIYFKFAFVRNPWDWLVSRYHWSKVRQRLFDYSFDEFLRRLKKRIRLSERALWLEDEALKPQLDRLTIRGAIAVDFVGRFENLQSDFDFVCSRLRIEPRTLQHVYRTNHAHYADYYSDENRKIVEQLYAIDIATFGYRFEDPP